VSRELERIEIRVGATESVLWIGCGVLEDAARYLGTRSGRWLLVSSRNAPDAASRVRSSLAGERILDFELDDTERAKTMDTVGGIVDRALEAGVRRDDALVAVGGGVVTDVAGFAAAILLRGIDWYAVPTTIAGMSDAAIGGKTGVDHPQGKNLVGAFHPPRAILADPSAARTLPDRDYRSGLVEAFKAAWIADPGLSDRAEADLDRLLARDDDDVVLDLIAGAARVKAQIVGSDPFERGPRRLLNFGHTLGHAFEAAGGPSRELRHGEAVAWGIAAALPISRTRAGLSKAEARRIRGVLARLGPFPEPVRDTETLRPLLARDKKATARGLAGVVLESIGRARVEESIPLAEWLAAARDASMRLE
jgi:3-dehydroquinate synthase